jgi:hypothetical protein
LKIKNLIVPILIYTNIFREKSLHNPLIITNSPIFLCIKVVVFSFGIRNQKVNVVIHNNKS